MLPFSVDCVVGCVDMFHRPWAEFTLSVALIVCLNDQMMFKSQSESA